MSKRIYLFVPIFLVFCILFSFLSPMIVTSENISQKVFRLHILANSDSAEDQNLKLDVRDYVLQKSASIFENADSLEQAIEKANSNIDEFEKYAKQAIEKLGYDYPVSVKVDKEYFDTRTYDNFYMPAGVYNCLKIIIGEGKGHNWWCVMYPSVCLSGCTDDFDSVLTEEEKEFITSSKFVPRFKIVEFYEYVKYKISET